MTKYCLLLTILSGLLIPDLLANPKNPFYQIRAAHQSSVLVKRLSDGKEIFAKNSDTALSPASVSKLVIAAAALDHFSPTYQFETNFLYDGSMRNGRISGNLYIRGSGDPMIINEKLWQLAADFAHMGLKEISGSLIIDASIFDAEDLDRSRKSSKAFSRNAYNAPISGFSVNFNTFPVAFASGEGIGSPARVSIDPYPVAGIQITNTSKTTQGTRSRVQAVRTTKPSGNISITASGQVGLNAPIRKVYRAMSNPAIISGDVIRGFLKQHGIDIKGPTKLGKAPKNVKTLYTLKGFQLRRLIAGLNRYSNNHIADSLLKALGAYHRGGQSVRGQGSVQTGLAVVTKFLQTKGKSPSKVQLYNGSGLDPRNRLSAADVVNLLEYMSKRADLYPEFLASLPAAGWDGTLKGRFNRGDLVQLKGHMRAKTGTLTQPITVSSLAGYVHHPKHGMLAFAIIDNGVARKSQPGVTEFRRRQDLAIRNIIKNFN
ncbi:MAG: D-alanyl-D-alanine carboxypeptidase/D-alanyl-D-alanine-endopeptidase [Pseudobacteriovorax sp.]|nr:D-alanyl-D-alanine carboxypeptidase/D-alanyl-D-alanine-endopeptidase [Pseudobacteriovorax sp.]